MRFVAPRWSAAGPRAWALVLALRAQGLSCLHEAACCARFDQQHPARADLPLRWPTSRDVQNERHFISISARLRRSAFGRRPGRPNPQPMADWLATLAAPASPEGAAEAEGGVRKGTNGVSTDGVTANYMFLTEGPFGYSL